MFSPVRTRKTATPITAAQSNRSKLIWTKPLNAKKAGPNTVPRNNTAITNVHMRALCKIGMDQGMIANRIRMRSKVMRNNSSPDGSSPPEGSRFSMKRIIKFAGYND
ncbi:hypothetical protein RESH_01984 [Rhodopirellula europaea SH398]|uniref:Uncharacterized protein n=1 Tax=Rhodopirellula europaea SH398 TaxID=1263868 RepID=M5SIM9_9BACT|nr:hypothetical protein RESH_01984 [Rhodopirellula europaea SH398]